MAEKKKAPTNRQFPDRALYVPRSAAELLRAAASQSVSSAPVQQLNASHTRVRLLVEITEFEELIDANQEVGVALVQSGSHTVMRLEEVGFRGPDLIVFRGRDTEGALCKIVQHVTQANLTLKALPKQGKVARRIGFLGDSDAA